MLVSLIYDGEQVKTAIRRQVACEYCDGSGKRDLRAVEADTLTAVTPAWETTDAIRRKIGGRRPTTTALLNRLGHLSVLGLVDKRQVPLDYRALEWRLK